MRKPSIHLFSLSALVTLLLLSLLSACTLSEAFRVPASDSLANTDPQSDWHAEAMRGKHDALGSRRRTPLVLQMHTPQRVHRSRRTLRAVEPSDVSASASTPSSSRQKGEEATVFGGYLEGGYTVSLGVGTPLQQFDVGLM
jgi:hypothetical protein